MHMRFALSLCLMQLAKGRMFMFEHPAGASSWGTKMMQEMLSKEGVYLTKFDFCQLDMKVLDKNGLKTSAKKRTAVLTNSKHLAEILRQAQRDGSHRHEPLGEAMRGVSREVRWADLQPSNVKSQMPSGDRRQRRLLR